MMQASLQVKNITRFIGAKCLLDNISFTLSRGEKVGLVGLNGCGKSTLLKIIAGSEKPDGGSITVVPRNVRIGYLPQLIDFQKTTAGQVIEAALDEASLDEEWQRTLLKKSALEEVGLSDLTPDHPANLLSGGQKTKLYLATLLIMQLDFLLLDEPTNFLDLEGLQRIGEFTRSRSEGIIVVSHDRYFLDKSIDRIIEIDDGTLREYAGNFSFYRMEKESRREQLLENYHRQQDEIQRLQSVARQQMVFAVRAGKGPKSNDLSRNINWGFVGAGASRHAKKAKAIEKRIERMEKIEKPRQNYMARINFEKSATSRIVARVENLEKSFPGKTLYKNVNFTIGAGEKVGILGENGSGKTTLLNILRKSEEPTSGSAFFLDSPKVGYFSQVFGDLNPSITVLEQVTESTGMTIPDARQMLAFFRFIREDVFKKTGNLSIGERSLLALACIRARDPEVLVLDEPTNHLDVDTVEILENALLRFSGTVLIVSHDRYLLDRLTERLLVIKNKSITSYPGNYSYYSERTESDTDDILLSDCGQ